MALIGTTGNNVFIDYGSTANMPVTAEDWMPSTPQNVALNDWLLTTVIGATGTSISLGAAATAAVSNATIYHDNVPNIRAALNANGSVEIPCGTFQVSATQISVPAGAMLQGSGSCSLLKEMTGVVGVSSSIYLSSNTTLKNISIDGGNWNQAQIAGSLVAAGPSSNVVIDHNTISHFWGMAIAFTSTSYSSIIFNNIAMDSGKVTPNQCINLSDAAGTPVQNFVTDNICVNTAILATTSRSHLDRNTISGWQFGSGIAVGPSSNTALNTINGNVIFSGGANPGDTNTTAGACIEDWSPWSVVSGNLGFACGAEGLSLLGTNSTATGNTFGTNGQSGQTNHQAGILLLYSSAAYNGNPNGSTITGNNLFDAGPGTQKYGIQAFGTGISVCEQGNNGQGLTANVYNPNGSLNNLASCF